MQMRFVILSLLNEYDDDDVVKLVIKPSIFSPVARQPLHGNRFVPRSLEGCPDVIPEYKVDRTTRYWVKAYFSCIHYVPVWPWPLTLFPKIGSLDREAMINMCAYFDVNL